MPPKKGQRQARGLARQDKILDVAFEAFATDGVRGTTVASVADKVGLSEAGLLHHFASKDELLLAVLDRVDMSYTETEVWVAESSGVLESLRRLPATARVLAERPQLARLRTIVSAEAVVHDGAARRYVRERTELIRNAFSAAIAKGIRGKEIRPDIDPDAVAAEIVAFTEGIQIEWILAPDAIDLVAAYESYIDALVAVIAAPAPATR